MKLKIEIEFIDNKKYTNPFWISFNDFNAYYKLKKYGITIDNSKRIKDLKIKVVL